MSGEVEFFLDGKPVRARPGEKVLWAALDHGVFIPHLCAIREREESFGSCRLCFVEVEGRGAPVLSCSEPVVEGMRVQTGSERVDRLRRTGLELLLSHHDLDCKNCSQNGACALQELAKALKVSLRPRRFRKLPTEMPIDESHPQIVLNPNRCVLCGRCVWVCNEVEGSGVLDFAFRGLRTRVAPFRLEPLARAGCSSCLRCAEVCPVGAITKKDPRKTRPGAVSREKGEPGQAGGSIPRCGHGVAERVASRGRTGLPECGRAAGFLPDDTK